ncbi:hypothetical protein ASPVEDRAFT_81377 [Aspergillus versicolor CBS 583.65]|uniref:Uncharacterized protein n=1 Tax=Aspergillus versicolor CBS 583.65 TaxID=1036611 RepID=A0A1L9PE26_ASPVE|nr:uncharacterized protein ASPVEDRAFT_81377 [Aspergillus versicolor CBS 583.65]OJI99786.1 hypothetical protein ASPVEDRAFT_81377 [Aspergillus versicolor CBS 583.65]
MPTHLIVVCCHAIYVGGPNKGQDEEEWLIEPFQRGETPTFTEHVKAGIRLLAQDAESLLVFSGGATKRPATEITEGNSYLNLAKDNQFFGYASRIDPSRVTAETHAADSYQNVLFSIIHFRLYTGVYPQRVTVVTHEFKRERFMECHFPAVGMGEQGRGSVVGINPPEEVTPLEELVEGEEKRGIGLWREDKYGVGGELKDKRVKRGWVDGMERGLWVGVGLETVVEDLVCWDSGEWFPWIIELPWCRA